MYAIVQTGGKQYKVSEGDILHVEKLSMQPGETLSLDVLMVVDGKKTKIGTPIVKDYTATAKLVTNVKGKKIIVFKYKPKKNYRKKSGHRQPYSRIEIVSIAAKKKEKEAPAEQAAE